MEKLQLHFPTSQKLASNLTISTVPFAKSKTLGPDNTPCIILTDPNYCDCDNLLEMCSYNFETADASPVWLTSDNASIPRKDSIVLFQNYRGISLPAIAAKIYNQLILNRLFYVLNPILWRNQNGFRKGRSTTAQILSHQRIIYKMNNGSNDYTIIFVDFKKAFDSINRDIMNEILALHGIPE